MTKNTGGPAFAVAELANITWEGMTLRDYFAAKAMQGMLASADSWINKDEVEGFGAICYAIADGMLKARDE